MNLTKYGELTNDEGKLLAVPANTGVLHVVTVQPADEFSRARFCDRAYFRCECGKRTVRHIIGLVYRCAVCAREFSAADIIGKQRASE